MEIKLIKGEKNTQVVKVLSAEDKAKINESRRSIANVDENGDLNLSRWSNKALEKFGGIEKIVNRIKKKFPKLDITLVEPEPTPEPTPEPAPAPEPAPENG